MMLSGIMRRLDDLGRIVIPREVRIAAFGTAETTGEPFEIYYKKGGIIILKPYDPTLKPTFTAHEIDLLCNAVISSGVGTSKELQDKLYDLLVEHLQEINE